MPRLITTALLLVALALGGVLAFRQRATPLGGTEVTPRPQVPTVRLQGQDGRAHSLTDWRGQTRLVFFGYTRCPDVCPTTLGVLARAYEALSPARQQQVKIVLVTVDPQHDTPEQLRDYLAHFNRDFIGLTGKEEALAVMQKGFYVYSVRDKQGNVSHGDTLAVVDGQGHFRRVYNQQDVANGTLTRDLPRLADGRL